MNLKDLIKIALAVGLLSVGVQIYAETPELSAPTAAVAPVTLPAAR